MKVTAEPTKNFKPFKLTIEFETEREFLNFRHYISATTGELQKVLPLIRYGGATANPEELFNILTEICRTCNEM